MGAVVVEFKSRGSSLREAEDQINRYQEHLQSHLDTDDIKSFIYELPDSSHTESKQSSKVIEEIFSEYYKPISERVNAEVQPSIDSKLGSRPDLIIYYNSNKKGTPENNAQAVKQPPTEWGFTHTVGFLLATTPHVVDQFIENKGLDGAVDEAKRRRWIAELTATLLAIFYYLNKM